MAVALDYRVYFLDAENHIRRAVDYLVGLPVDELGARLAALPEGSAVLWLRVSGDHAGKRLVNRDALGRICETANAPVYAMNASHLGTGIVGGRLADPDALSEATVALFPYRAEVDLSGALLQVLGAGVPAIVYDIGGLGEVVGRFGAGAVVEPGDTAAMSRSLALLLQDPDALATARAGAERARDELTWEASAAAHLGLYRMLT